MNFPIGTQRDVQYSCKMLKWLIIQTRSVDFGQLWRHYSRSVVFVFPFIHRILYSICHNSWKFTAWDACIQYIRYWNRQLYSTSEKSGNWQFQSEEHLVAVCFISKSSTDRISSCFWSYVDKKVLTYLATLVRSDAITHGLLKQYHWHIYFAY